MRFFYLDPGLMTELGHHAVSCRTISEELSRRAIYTRVFACREVTRKIQRELGAKPHFRCWTYGVFDNDPVSGVLNNFELTWTKTREDLDRLGAMSRQDIVFVNSVLPAQFMALVRWAGALSPHRRPNVVVEFGLPLPSVEQRTAAERTSDFSAQFTRMLYRHVMLHFTAELARRFHLATFDTTCSEAYEQLLGTPVVTIPLPREAVTDRRDRSSAEPITVALIGHQRPDKGYGLLPDFLPRLLCARPNVRVLVHNGDVKEMPRVQDALQRLARREPRIILDECVADAQRWSELLEQADLIVCPYDPSHFAAGYSSVVAEAIANAIPVIVPADTSMATLLKRYGLPGTLIMAFNAEATLDAVLSAVDDFPRLARLASEAAQQWSRTQGGESFVRTVLDLAQADLSTVAGQIGSRVWALGSKSLTYWKPVLRSFRNRLLSRSR